MRDLLSEDGMIEAGASVAALAESAAAEAGKELPEDLRGGDEDLEKAQEKVKQAQVDTSAFDALVEAELKELTANEAQARMIHLEENLKITAKNSGKKIPEFKAYVASGGFFHPYKNKKQEDKPGYWKTFLAWEQEKYPPEPDGEDEGQPGEGGGGEIPFAEQKRLLTMEILRLNIPLADLELASMNEITPDNIEDIEARVKNWEPPKKK